MAVLREIRRRSRQIIPAVLLVCTLAYFAYHAVQGDRGILAWQRLNQELGEARTRRAALTAERAELEHRVGLLSPDHLDPDLLDEQARLLLNYGRPEDRIVLLPAGAD